MTRNSCGAFWRRLRGLRFGQIILAAADIDRDLFTQLAPNYLKVSDRTTVYLSLYDYAIGLSDIVHDYPRVGCGSSPQVAIPGIDSVVSTIPSDFPGHAYFAGSLPVLTDVKNLILRIQPARQGRDWTKRATTGSSADPSTRQRWRARADSGAIRPAPMGRFKVTD